MKKSTLFLIFLGIGGTYYFLSLIFVPLFCSQFNAEPLTWSMLSAVLFTIITFTALMKKSVRLSLFTPLFFGFLSVITIGFRYGERNYHNGYIKVNNNLIDKYGQVLISRNVGRCDYHAMYFIAKDILNNDIIVRVNFEDEGDYNEHEVSDLNFVFFDMNGEFIDEEYYGGHYSCENKKELDLYIKDVLKREVNLTIYMRL